MVGDLSLKPSGSCPHFGGGFFWLRMSNIRQSGGKFFKIFGGCCHDSKKIVECLWGLVFRDEAAALPCLWGSGYGGVRKLPFWSLSRGLTRYMRGYVSLSLGYMV